MAQLFVLSFFIQTYIISLYCAEKITDENLAIKSNIERSLRMQIITPLATSKAVSENIQNGMKDGLGSLYHQQKELVEDLRKVIEQSGVQYKDTIDIYYTSKGELKLYKNEGEIYTNKDRKIICRNYFQYVCWQTTKRQKN
jgi:hypothetical protein